MKDFQKKKFVIHDLQNIYKEKKQVNEQLFADDANSDNQQ